MMIIILLLLLTGNLSVYGNSTSDGKLNRGFITKLIAANPCETCELMANSFMLIMKFPVNLNLWCNLVIGFIDIQISVKICSDLFTLNSDIFRFILSNRPNINGKIICALIFQDKKCFPKELDTFSIYIPPKINSSNNSFDDSRENVLKILQITDPHYDRSYQVDSDANCKKIMCCRGDVTNVQNNKAGAWGAYKCDAPLNLLNNSFSEITKKGPFDYIYYTGDIVPHNIWETSIDSVKLALYEMHTLIKKYFPKIMIFPLIGNHDTHPMNIFAPKNVPQNFSTQWVYNYFADQWADWLPNEALATVRLGGYYTVVPQKGFRIIALNFNVAYVFNWWLLYSQEEYNNQLTWLVKTLEKAEENNEVVHILTHILPSNPHLFKHWGVNFRRILERFHINIKGIFYGHTHKEEFNLYLQKDNLQKALVAAFNGGSLTPYENVNPNFKIYSVSGKNYEILNYDQWIFDISKKDPEWKKLYDFKSAYNVDNLRPDTLLNLVQQMATNNTTSALYERFKWKDAPRKTCDQQCIKKNICDIVSNDFFDEEKCKTLTGN